MIRVRRFFGFLINETVTGAKYYKNECFWLYLDFVLCHVLEIEFIEMREPAVPAPDGEMPAANCKIMGTSYMAVSACCGFYQPPDVVTPDFCECPRLGDIFNTGNKDPGRTTVITRNFSLIRDRFDDLICNLPAMVTVSAEFGENELFAHEKYWICPGSLICCTMSSQALRVINGESRNPIRKNGDSKISAGMVGKT